MKAFGGPVLFLDRSDINTDEIIPAKYLTEVKKEALKPYLLEDLTLPGFDPAGEALQRARVIVTRENFGCGSSREHAPWALEVNDITVVIARSFARIFRQNMYNCGMMALEMSNEDIDAMFAMSPGGNVSGTLNIDKNEMVFSGPRGAQKVFSFMLSQFDEALVRAGGWLEFADAKY
jgi:3-isopropylmalate/(R)-2-methylmalate dehydratase small subunit